GGARPERPRGLRDRRDRGGAGARHPGHDPRRGPCNRRRAGGDGRPARRGRPALTGLRELRPVPRLRRAGRGVQAAGGEPAYVTKGQFEARLLLLVSFGLVAFGLVMVYSATSAS